MTTLAAIRTNRWDEDAKRIHDQLKPVFGDDLVVVFHNRPKGLDLPCAVVDIDDAWVTENRLHVLHDWGWRCGDYFLYALRQARPDADFLWLIEPDVHFTATPAGFFDRFDATDADLLGVDPERTGPNNRFARGLHGLEPWRAIFALTRFSARAIDRLFTLRQDYCTRGVALRVFANDEVFCFSHVMADPDLTVGSIRAAAPGRLAGGSVATNPDILFEVLNERGGPGVFHPVRSRASFKKALAQRLSGNTGYLRRMSDSLGHLTESEIDEIVTQAALVMRCALVGYSLQTERIGLSETTRTDKKHA